VFWLQGFNYVAVTFINSLNSITGYEAETGQVKIVNLILEIR